MKKIILLALTAVMMVGCLQEREPIESGKYIVFVFDSCEYIMPALYTGFMHKGNCHFCAERRKQELKELVEQLKEK